MAQEFYDQAANSVIIDGTPIEDYFEGEGSIAFAPTGDLVSENRGSDRNALSLGSRRTGRLTFIVKPTSPSLAFLNQIIENQENGAPVLFDATVSAGVLDVLSLDRCLLVDNDYSTGGPTMEPRSFTLVASNYRKRD